MAQCFSKIEPMAAEEVMMDLEKANPYRGEV
jgi:hypothetical protein